MASTHQVVIADDHPIFREGLERLLTRESAFEVAAAVGDGRSAVRAVSEHAPDVAIFDLDMPGGSGLDALRAMGGADSPTPVIILTMHNDEDVFNEAMDAGVRGYVLKDCATADLVDCVHAVMHGKTYISPTIAHLLMDRYQRRQSLVAAKPALEELTPAERRVLKLVAANLTSKEIAQKLSLSPRTIEHHRANVCAKLGLNGAHSLVKWALDHRSEL